MGCGTDFRTHSNNYFQRGRSRLLSPHNLFWESVDNRDGGTFLSSLCPFRRLALFSIRLFTIVKILFSNLNLRDLTLSSPPSQSLLVSCLGWKTSCLPSPDCLLELYSAPRKTVKRVLRRAGHNTMRRTNGVWRTEEVYHVRLSCTIRQ